LNTIASDSHIVLLESGQVVEQGSSNDLLAKNGAFAQLFNSNDTI
jgi:ABC-type multidrug transport system fused ATPase/permease subunit